MGDDTRRSAPVLIVGAGPAGLVTAIELARRGIRSTLVERRDGTSGLPRATAISTRTMELMRHWGLEDHVRAGAADVEFLGWAGTTLADRAGEAFSVGFPTRDQAKVISPTAPTGAPQDHLEPVLLAHLRTFGLTEIRFGTELIELDQNADGARAVLRNRASGAISVIDSAFVVGADGAHSTVRDLLGIRLTGPDRLVEHVSTLFRAPLWQVVQDRRFGIYVITHPQADGIFVPSGPGDRWMYGQELSSDGSGLEDYTPDRLTELIRTASGVPDLDPQILQTSSFSFAAQIVERYRDRRVFLVGDAAHRVTPRGGTGLNTAIHDAFDLGWKLGWVMRGWGPEQLLDTYETERRPIGLANTARSADPDGTRSGADDALSRDLNGRLPHAWTRAGVSTLDLLGLGYTLLTGVEGDHWRLEAAAIAGLGPLGVHVVDDIVAQTLGVGRGGAVLVRPDGQTAASWPPEPAHARILQASSRA